MMAQVIDNGDMSEKFGVSNDTKQGCVLAPLQCYSAYSFPDVDGKIQGLCHWCSNVLSSSAPTATYTTFVRCYSPDESSNGYDTQPTIC